MGHVRRSGGHDGNIISRLGERGADTSRVARPCTVVQEVEPREICAGELRHERLLIELLSAKLDAESWTLAREAPPKCLPGASGGARDRMIARGGSKNPNVWRQSLKSCIVARTECCRVTRNYIEAPPALHDELRHLLPPEPTHGYIGGEMARDQEQTN